MKPMDRIRRAMALRRAHEATEAAAGGFDERDTQTSQAEALHQEAERRQARAEAKAGARIAKTKPGEN